MLCGQHTLANDAKDDSTGTWSPVAQAKLQNGAFRCRVVEAEIQAFDYIGDSRIRKDHWVPLIRLERYLLYASNYKENSLFLDERVKPPQRRTL